MASPAAAPEPGLTTGEWLGRWLASRVSLCASTSRSYAAHVRGHLVPYLGGIPLAEDFCNTHRPHRTLNQAALRPLPDSVTDLDHFRVLRRARAGSVMHEYRLMA